MQVKWPQKYGEIYVTYIGTHRNVNLTSPELAEVIHCAYFKNKKFLPPWPTYCRFYNQKVFNSQKILDKGADYDFLLPWLGDGLLLSAGKFKSVH